jgi:Na+-transporting NADH:ubiquinone oxidoreductase subunit NqrD
MGKPLVMVVLSSFMGSLYLLLITLLNPFLALETAFIITLAPVSCISSGVCRRVANLDPEEAVLRSIMEALILGGLLLAVALIREPLGNGSLSVPGGVRGIIELFSGGDTFIFPVRIVGSAAGAFLLMGYGLALFRFFRSRQTGEES